MKSNIQLLKLIQELKTQASKAKVGIWKRVASDLEKPTRSRRIVNLYKLNKYTKPEETVIVPGKVLSVGDIDHKINIAAYSFSNQAKEKILKAKGSVLTIYELMKSNPEGKNIRIMG